MPKKYEIIAVRVPYGEKQKYKDAAQRIGMTLSELVLYSMHETLKTRGIWIIRKTRGMRFRASDLWR